MTQTAANVKAIEDNDFHSVRNPSVPDTPSLYTPIITTAHVNTISTLTRNATKYSISSIREKSGIAINVFCVIPLRLAISCSSLTAATTAALFLSTTISSPSLALSIFSIGAPRITSLQMLTIAIQFVLVAEPFFK